MTHELKTWPEYFEEVLQRRKMFEVRKNDRNFQVGDTLILKEWELGGHGMTDHDLTGNYTGRKCERTVGYVLHGGKFGIDKDFVVLSIF